jgi:hypothetical protein
MRGVLRTVVQLCAVVALLLVPAASASAASVSSSCNKQVLLLPGMTVSCGTAVVSCPPPPSTGLTLCRASAKAVAGAAVGVSIGGKAVSTTGGAGAAFGTPKSTSATCSGGLALLNGCTAQTGPNEQPGISTTLVAALPPPLPPVVQTSTFTAQGACQWTGGPVAVLATLSCTETMAY